MKEYSSRIDLREYVVSILIGTLDPGIDFLPTRNQIQREADTFVENIKGGLTLENYALKREIALGAVPCGFAPLITFGSLVSEAIQRGIVTNNSLKRPSYRYTRKNTMAVVIGQMANFHSDGVIKNHIGKLVTLQVPVTVGGNAWNMNGRTVVTHKGNGEFVDLSAEPVLQSHK